MEHLRVAWSTEQLTELLALASAATDAAAVTASVIDRAAAAAEAEIAAFIIGQRVEASIGFAANRVPEPELIEAATHRRRILTVIGTR